MKLPWKMLQRQKKQKQKSKGVDRATYKITFDVAVRFIYVILHFSRQSHIYNHHMCSPSVKVAWGLERVPAFVFSEYINSAKSNGRLLGACYPLRSIYYQKSIFAMEYLHV